MSPHRNFPPLIGLTIEDAMRQIYKNRYVARFSQINSAVLKKSNDFNCNRVNLHIENDIVIGYDFY